MDTNTLVVVTVVIIGTIALYVLLERRIAANSGNAELVDSLRQHLAQSETKEQFLNAAAAQLNKQLGEVSGAHGTLRQLHEQLLLSSEGLADRLKNSETQLSKALNDVSRSDEGALRAKSELVARESDLDAAQRGLKEARADREAQTLAANSAQRTVDSLSDERTQLRLERDRAMSDRDQARVSERAARTAEAEAVANARHLQESNVEMKQFLDEAQTRLSAAFAEMAGKVFGERALLLEAQMKSNTDQSKADIDALLKPVTQRLLEFRERVDHVYGEEAKDRAGLIGAIGKLEDLNKDIATKASELTRALRGNAKVRGDWGEMMLDTVLSSSGLIDGQHYTRQEQTTDQDGNALRPDVIVNLPDGRRVVVDAKVNLPAYQEACNADTPEAQREAMLRHVAGLRQHVRNLGDKAYPKHADALDVTIAFVPIEGALSAALETDPNLQTDAFSRHVVFASPNTLMAMLSVVDRLWTRDKVQKQAKEIGDAGGLVLDALTNFLATFERIGKHLSQATGAYDEARKTLSESNQAVIPRARRLAELGARGKKLLAKELQPDPGLVEVPLMLAATDVAADKEVS